METPAVRTSTVKDQAWADLATELTPARSLARIDVATNRVVTTITVLGMLITGFGVLAVGIQSVANLAYKFVILAVVAATLAVLTALGAQALTITRQLNTNNLSDVKEWYRRQFDRRGPLTQAATILLILAVFASGAAVVTSIATSRSDVPSLAVTRTTGPADQATLIRSGAQGNETADTVTVKATFRGLSSEQLATVAITVAGAILAQAAAAPEADGTASLSATVGQLPTDAHVTIKAQAAEYTCDGTLDPESDSPLFKCNRV